MPYKDKKKRYALHKIYYDKHRDILKQKSREYYAKTRERQLELKKLYTAKNKEIIAEKSKLYNRREKVRERRKLYNKEYQKNHKEEIRNRSREYYKENRDKIRQKLNQRLKTDENYRQSLAIRNKLNQAIRKNSKGGIFVKEIGCSVEELKKYIESKFQEGMTWDNWSRNGWNLDHIKPVALFDLTNREEYLKAVHYTNIQPLWAKDNILKGNKYDDNGNN